MSQAWTTPSWERLTMAGGIGCSQSTLEPPRVTVLTMSFLWALRDFTCDSKTHGCHGLLKHHVIRPPTTPKLQQSCCHGRSTHSIVPSGFSLFHACLKLPTTLEIAPPSLLSTGYLLHNAELPTREAVLPVVMEKGVVTWIDLRFEDQSMYLHSDSDKATLRSN